MSIQDISLQHISIKQIPIQSIPISPSLSLSRSVSFSLSHELRIGLTPGCKQHMSIQPVPGKPPLHIVMEMEIRIVNGQSQGFFAKKLCKKALC